MPLSSLRANEAPKIGNVLSAHALIVDGSHLAQCSASATQNAMRKRILRSISVTGVDDTRIAPGSCFV